MGFFQRMCEEKENKFVQWSEQFYNIASNFQKSSLVIAMVCQKYLFDDVLLATNKESEAKQKAYLL